MINWLQLLFNLLWLLGLALIVIAFSYVDWLAYSEGVRTRQLLGTRAFQLPLGIGLGLVSLGLFFLSQGWLEHIVWVFFTAVFAWQTWSLTSGSRRTP